MARQHFDSSIVKTLKNGTQVISTYLDKGEKLVTPNRGASIFAETSDTQTTLTSDETNTHTTVGEQKASDSPDEKPEEPETPAADARTASK